MKNPLASSCVVDSEDAKVWATAIQAVKEKPRSERLLDAQRLKKCCVTSFAWSKRCQALKTEMLALVREKKGDDKDSGEQRDEAATDAQCVQYMTEENEQTSQPASPSSRRFQAVENPQTCNHGSGTHQAEAPFPIESDNTFNEATKVSRSPSLKQKNDDNRNSELGSTANQETDGTIVAETSISPEVEETVLNYQKETESCPKQDELQQAKERFHQKESSGTKQESITGIRWRREERAQWRTDGEEVTKQYVNQSRTEGIKVKNINLGVTFILLVAIVVLFAIAAYI